MFYVIAVVVVMLFDLWFLGDVHMNEVRIIGFFGGKVGILGGNLGYPNKPKSGSLVRQNIGFNIVGCRQLWLVPFRSLSNVIMSLMH